MREKEGGERKRKDIEMRLRRRFSCAFGLNLVVNCLAGIR